MYDSQNIRSEIDSRRLFQALREKWWVIAAAALAAMVIAFVYAYFIADDVFEATTTVWAFRDTSDKQSVSSSEFNAYNALIKDIKELIRTDEIVGKANDLLAKDADYAELVASGKSAEKISKRKITVENTTDTRIVKIQVSGSTPVFVKAAADALATALLANIDEYIPVSGMKIVDYAKLPQSQTSPNRPLIIMMSMIIGLAIGFFIVLLYIVLDHRVKDPESFRANFDVPILAMIPDFAERESMAKSSGKRKRRRRASATLIDNKEDSGK